MRRKGIRNRTGAVRKPAYCVPTMAETVMVPRHGLKVVSTFSGCGGTCLGFRWAGFETLWASEFVLAAREVYKLNHPGVPVDARDIRDVKPEDILETIGLNRGELDVLEGSPPCASFSTAGRREASWGKVVKYSETKQRVDDLFFEFARILEGLMPRAFVAENVSGLVKGKAKGYFKDILKALRAPGYKVIAKVLDAQWLGVPQKRQRVIFFGVRDDLGVDPRTPLPLGYRYSVADALPWLGGVQAASEDGFSPVMHGAGTRAAPTVMTAPNKMCGDVVAAPANARCIHDESGDWSQGDVTDEAVPTVRSGRPALQVHAAAIQGNVGYEPVMKDARESPAPTVMTSPTKTCGNDVPAPRLVHDTSGQRSQGEFTGEPSPAVTVGVQGVYSLHYQVHGGERLEHDPETGERIIIEGDTTVAKIAEKCKPGKTGSSVTGTPSSWFNISRAPKDGPSQGILATGGDGLHAAVGVLHPVYKRRFTLHELRRVCSFPDDFALTGKYRQRWERMGRAVPPIMAFWIARSVREALFEADSREPWDGDPTCLIAGLEGKR